MASPAMTVRNVLYLGNDTGRSAMTGGARKDMTEKAASRQPFLLEHEHNQRISGLLPEHFELAERPFRNHRRHFRSLAEWDCQSGRADTSTSGTDHPNEEFITAMNWFAMTPDP